MIPVLKGKKINKILCLLFLGMAAISLAAAGVFALAKNPAAGHTFCVLALIFGGFALFYGMLWLIWSRKEKKAERALNEAAARQHAPEDPARADCREFVLPKDRLTEKARKRFHSILRWTGIAALGAYLLIGGLLFAFDSAKSPFQMVCLLVFCGLITVPGILVQRRLYRTYARSVPTRILLFPGKLVVDGTVFPSGEIREIRVSPEQIFNINSPGVFRELRIRTDGGGAQYRMDHRAGAHSDEQPFWEEYGAFVAALSDWGAENGVPVTVSFMD